jgi:ABC-type multidrug transport system fused ATPase/permease subunit
MARSLPASQVHGRAEGDTLSAVPQLRPAWVRAIQSRRLVIDQLFTEGTRRRVVFAVLGSILVALAEVLGVVALLPLMQILTGSDTESGLLGRLSDVFGTYSRTGLALIVSSVVFGAFVTKGLMTIAFRWWLLGFVNRQEAETSVAMLERYMTAPYWLHLQRNTASLLRTMSEAVSQTYAGVIVGSISIVTEIATLSGVVLALLVIMPGPTLVAVVYFGVSAYSLQRWTKRHSESAGTRLMDSSSLAYQAALQALAGVKEITVRQKAEHFVDSYRTTRSELAETRRTVAFLGEFPRYLLEIVFTVGVALMTVASFTLTDNEAGVTALALFVASGFRLLPSMVRLVASLNAVRVGRRGLALVLSDISEIHSRGMVEGTPSESLRIRRAIEVQDLSFRYAGSEATVLSHIDLTIPAGTSLAVVGSSGAGKSTLIDLLLGLHEPTRGRIVVDDVDIAMQLSGWQKAIGLVPQDVYLLDDTVRANIAFGENPEDIHDERITEAVSLAQLDDLVRDLPEGLDSLVGERGTRLSGGQRQRIGIARALYLRPELLVLDEATSALDNETERRITETIDQLRGQLTLVVVAHRLSTVRHADRLVFMNAGAIEAIGTFEEVRRTSSTFAHLVDLGRLDLVDTGTDDALADEASPR